MAAKGADEWQPGIEGRDGIEASGREKPSDTVPYAAGILGLGLGSHIRAES